MRYVSVENDDAVVIVISKRELWSIKMRLLQVSCAAIKYEGEPTGKLRSAVRRLLNDLPEAIT